jgi:hypothetical protein
MTTIKTIFDYLGYASTVLVLVSAITACVFWVRGIFPVLVRLGNGLSRRKIVIFAKGDVLISLANLLRDSKLFNSTNILKVPNESDIGIAETATLFLVYWPDWKNDLDKILRCKTDGTALIVYAPQEHGFIPKETMAVLDKQRNVVVNNFRGRLLNDIVASMITTSYEKK